MKKLLLLVISLGFIFPCFPETIKLKSGKTVEARIVEKTDKDIKVDIDGIPITYYLDEIESIDGATPANAITGEKSPQSAVSGKPHQAFILRCPEGLYTENPMPPYIYSGPIKIGSVGKAQAMPLYVYKDKGSAKNHFFPYGLMGDFGDIKYSYLSKENPYSGGTCVKIEYCACGFQGAHWAGMYWQTPANNWGTIDAGYNLSQATKLTFWARGEKGGENIEEFKVGGIKNEFSDSDRATTGPVTLNKEWTQYTIDLKDKDMSYIIGGFCWVANIDNNPNRAVFYLDEIKFE